MNSGLTVAVLGTGLMGYPMAENILKARYKVNVWNRTAHKAKPLKEFGATVYESPGEAVRNADVAIVMLTDGHAVENLLFDAGVAGSMTKGSTLIDMSSIKPAQAKEHANRLADLGVGYLDAPVSGGTKGAASGTLAIMVGGEQGVFDKVKPVLTAMGRPVRVGDNGAGQLAKLANQAIVGITIGAVAEAMLMAEQGGADPAAIRDALKGGFADSTILQLHGERMTTGNFEPGGLSTIQLKDMNNICEIATELGLELPLARQIRERYQALCNELNAGSTDHSGLYLELLHRNAMYK